MLKKTLSSNNSNLPIGKIYTERLKGLGLKAFLEA